MKNILLIFFVIISFFSFSSSYALTQEQNPKANLLTFENTLLPRVNCAWLPWCISDWLNTSWDSTSKDIGISFVKRIIWEFIQIVSVFAVFALIFSWVMYLLSSWEEEKANKAKKWIIWSLVWVFLSISAWWIINFLNNIKIN